MPESWRQSEIMFMDFRAIMRVCNVNKREGIVIPESGTLSRAVTSLLRIMDAGDKSSGVGQCGDFSERGDKPWLPPR